jgi:hypothetical protein
MFCCDKDVLPIWMVKQELRIGVSFVFLSLVPI